jgi:cyanophycinase
MAAKKSAKKSVEKLPVKAVARKVAKGTLIIIGGKEDKEGEKKILHEVARRASSGKLVVATVATDLPDEVWEEYRKLFSDLGVRDIEHLDIRSRTDALSEDAVRTLEGAAVVFFTGGDQLRITSQLGDSMVYRWTHQLLEYGGTVAGTSAGASVMSSTMLVSGTGDESPNIEAAVHMAPGLGFFPDAVVDQHFAERGRIGRLIAAITQNPRHLGVGIDEDTAIIVQGNEFFDVIGQGSVYVLDAAGVTYSNLVEGDPDTMLSTFDIRLHLLSEGFRYDLQNRRPCLPETQGKAKKKTA